MSANLPSRLAITRESTSLPACTVPLAQEPKSTCARRRRRGSGAEANVNECRAEGSDPTPHSRRARVGDSTLNRNTLLRLLKNCGPRGSRKSETCRCPETAAHGRDRHGPYLRCPYERHGVWYGGPAHVAGAAAGGVLALVKSDDTIVLDVAQRAIRVELDDATLAARRAKWIPPALRARGWESLYVEHVQQAHLGADLDFLAGKSGAKVARDSH
jgi:L-arabonate dehydrase